MVQVIYLPKVEIVGGHHIKYSRHRPPSRQSARGALIIYSINHCMYDQPTALQVDTIGDDGTVVVKTNIDLPANTWCISPYPYPYSSSSSNNIDIVETAMVWDIMGESKHHVMSLIKTIRNVEAGSILSTIPPNRNDKDDDDDDEAGTGTGTDDPFLGNDNYSADCESDWSDLDPEETFIAPPHKPPTSTVPASAFQVDDLEMNKLIMSSAAGVAAAHYPTKTPPLVANLEEIIKLLSSSSSSSPPPPPEGTKITIESAISIYRCAQTLYESIYNYNDAAEDAPLVTACSELLSKSAQFMTCIQNQGQGQGQNQTNQLQQQTNNDNYTHICEIVSKISNLTDVTSRTDPDASASSSWPYTNDINAITSAIAAIESPRTAAAALKMPIGVVESIIIVYRHSQSLHSKLTTTTAAALSLPPEHPHQKLVLATSMLLCESAQSLTRLQSCLDLLQQQRQQVADDIDITVMVEIRNSLFKLAMECRHCINQLYPDTGGS